MAESISVSQDPPVVNICARDLHLKASSQSLNIVEIREMIMLQLDPLSLLNLVSLSESALASFDRSPINFLNSTLTTLNVDGSAGMLPVAILEASKSRPDDGYIEDREQHVREHSSPKADLDKFLNEFVIEGHWQFPDNVQQPLDSLRQLAGIWEAVETLVDSSLWTCIRAPSIGAKAWIDGRWFSQKGDMRRVLWVYQLFCTLYHRPGTTGQGAVHFPSMNSQMKYVKAFGERETPMFLIKLVNIYRDLSSFLAKIYEENWARIFDENYRYYTKFSQDLREELPMTTYHIVYPGYGMNIVAPEYWSHRKVVHNTHCDFYRYIDYEMSKGLPHLAHMYRLSLESDLPDYPVQKYWTDSFFTNTFRERTYGQPELCCSTWCKGYFLEPPEEGKNGYRLFITVPSTKGDYLFRAAEPLFVDEEFQPTHLGSLSSCLVRKEKVD